MAISLTTAARINGQLTSTRDGGGAVFDVNEGQSKTLDNGTGINQANAIYVDKFSIAASGTLSTDISGTLTDAHGNTMVFTAIKEIMVIADDGNTNNIVLGGGANAFVGAFGAAAHTVAVAPGSRADLANFSAAGWAVTAGTGDIVLLTNSAAGTAVTGTLVIVGEA